MVSFISSCLAPSYILTSGWRPAFSSWALALSTPLPLSPTGSIDPETRRMGRLFGTFLRSSPRTSFRIRVKRSL